MSRKSRNEMRLRRHKRVRAKVIGTLDRPRLNVFRSNREIYVQIVDDQEGNTLIAASSLEEEIQSSAEGKSKLEAAKLVGHAVAKRAKAKGIKQVVFDRGGYRYHGRVKALAEAAREAGLEF